MTERYAHVLSFALTHPWAILPDMLQVIAGVLARRIAGEEPDAAAIQAALVNRKNLPQPRAGSVAIIPVYGVLAPRMNLMSEMSGGTTYDKLTNQLRAAMADKTIKTIVLDVDSPGGSVAGANELATEIMRARTKKPIIAQAQYLMGSAAYQLGSAATKIVAAPSARVGGIGTFGMHDDLSEALKTLGVKRTYISAGDGKVDGNDTEPLSDTARGRMQAAVNDAYEQFVTTVVRGRGAGTTAERVRKDWKAHVYGATEASALGLIDEIATLDDTLSRVLNASPDEADQRAALDLTTSALDTAQEPDTVTAQDRSTDLHWQMEIERSLYALAFDGDRT
jgi:signal peptide peptidase SppA